MKNKITILTLLSLMFVGYSASVVADTYEFVDASDVDGASEMDIQIVDDVDDAAGDVDAITYESYDRYAKPAVMPAGWDSRLGRTQGGRYEIKPIETKPIKKQKKPVTTLPYYDSAVVPQY
jgi:hypothetical protein